MRTMRSMRSWCVAACVALSACAGAQKVEEERAPALMNAGEVVERYARWLPGDSIVVAVVDVDATIAYVAGEPIPMLDPDREAKVAARKVALREDLSRLSRERLGMDVTGASKIIVGGGLLMQTVVLLGVSPAAKDAVDVEGMKAFQIAPRHPEDEQVLDRVARDGIVPWALALPEGKGVVLFANRRSLDALAGSDGMSLAKANIKEEYVGALGRLPSRLAFVAGTGALAPFLGEFEAEVGFKAPRIVSGTFGDHLGVLLRGDPAALEALEDMRKEQQETVLGQIEPQYAKLGEMPTPVAMGVAMGYHLTLGLEEKLDVRLEGDSLSYTISSNLMATTASAGVLAAIAIPAFLRSVKKSKTAESEQVMRKMVDGAKTYFTIEHKYEPSQPWHVDPTGGSRIGFPVVWEEYVFPGGTDFTFRSSDEIPQGGAKVSPKPFESLSPLEQAALNKLGVDLNEPLYFRYTITTGPQRGYGATFMITAEADFDPSSPAVHTVVTEVRVDEYTQEVQVTPPFTINEFE